MTRFCDVHFLNSDKLKRYPPPPTTINCVHTYKSEILQFLLSFYISRIWKGIYFKVQIFLYSGWGCFQLIGIIENLLCIKMSNYKDIMGYSNIESTKIPFLSKNVMLKSKNKHCWKLNWKIHQSSDTKSSTNFERNNYGRSNVYHTMNNYFWWLDNLHGTSGSDSNKLTYILSVSHKQKWVGANTLWIDSKGRIFTFLSNRSY